MRSMKSQVMFVLGVIALACSVMPALHAQAAVTPEIDANSLASGLALASAAALMFRARRRTK
jgi:hypothetical protein